MVWECISCVGVLLSGTESAKFYTLKFVVSVRCVHETVIIETSAMISLDLKL